MVMGEPKMIPPGDFIRFMNTAGKIGMNLISGSTGIVPKPGFAKIAEKMAEKILSNGGEIMTGADVKEVLLKNTRVSGIRAETAAGEEQCITERVVCTVPIKKVWQFLPKSLFPEALVEKVDHEFFRMGMLTGYLGVDYDVFGEAGVNPKSWLLAPSSIKTQEGCIGDMDIISIMPSNFAPSLSPEGRYSLAFSMALTEQELRNKKKGDHVIDTSRQLFHKAFPPLKDHTLWEIWTCSDKGFGDWGSGMDAAIYSALLCADELSRQNYTEQVLPQYHR